LPDTGAGFVEIKNQALKQANGKTTVTFDVAFDAASIDGQKIVGATLDLKYQYSSVAAAQVASVKFDDPVFGDKIDVWENITSNLTSTGNGKIVMTAKGLSSTDTTVIDANPRIDVAANGKAIGVTLVINQLVDSFVVGFDKATDSPAGVTSLTLANNASVVPELGIDKTARLAGTVAGPKTGALEVSTTKQTVAAGIDEANYPILSSAPTDNQLKVLQIIESADNVGDKAKYGTLQFQYDTNPAAGTTVLSPIVEVAMVSTDIAAFFESNYAKLI
jgi:hypothetical protein